MKKFIMGSSSDKVLKPSTPPLFEDITAWGCEKGVSQKYKEILVDEAIPISDLTTLTISDFHPIHIRYRFSVPKTIRANNG